MFTTCSQPDYYLALPQDAIAKWWCSETENILDGVQK